MKKLIAVFLVAAAFMLSGCQTAPDRTPTRTTIGEGQAGDIALQIASQSRPEIDASSAAPSVNEIHPMSLQAALQIMQAVPGADEDLSRPVWLVTLNGLWYVGQAPGITPTPCRTYFVILDEWGHELRTSIK